MEWSRVHAVVVVDVAEPPSPPHSYQVCVQFARVREALVVVCVGNILEARADSRFYRVLLKLLVVSTATGSQGHSVLLA